MKGNRLRAGVLLAAATVFLLTAAACGEGGGGTASPSPSESPSPSTPSPTETSTPTPTPTEMMQVSVYFLRDDKVAAAHRRIPKTQGVLAAALDQVLAGPTAVEQAAGLSSAVPADLRILGVKISGGTAIVDVDGSIAAGGPQPAVQRLAQLTYTATQFATVKRVRFLQNGDPISGEGSGMSLTQPVTRDSFEAVTPAIFVESPAVADTVKSPLLVWGTANTFEAQFWLEIQTAGGKTLLKKQVTATSGSGTRGTFRASLAFTPQGTAGRLVAYDISMADGSRIDVVVIPLKFKQ